MAQVIADRRDVDFVLHEQMKVEKFTKHKKFAEYNKQTIDMIISEARQLAIKELLPTQALGDEGCEFDNGKVKVPPSFHKPYKLYKEGEWLALSDDPEIGGQGVPKTVALAASEYFNGANVAFMLYSSLSHGAVKLIEKIGTEKQKKLFIGKLLTGEWAGTMLLTEANAGSDVGALTTMAQKNDDGTYSITGEKIFISGGEQDLTENIVHPVLARIEGAAPGTRGISLFLVPKYRVNDDGSLGEFNDVVCTGIEEKMGLHGNSTCTLALGNNGKCIGTLLGEENRGVRAMFVMMNDARQLVGLQGFSVASTAYLHALNYAKERIQGKNMLKPKDADVTIIKHPDVRRQLLIMKAFVEGMRSLIYYSGTCFDAIATSEDEEEVRKYMAYIEILTPIIKGYITDRAWDVCSHGVQVFGGYGYTKDFPAEQLLRDSRIFMIYEGTNGIQAMDLIGRKLGLGNGKVVTGFLSEIKQHIDAAKNVPGLVDLAVKVEEVFNKYSEMTVSISKTLMSEKINYAYAQATPLLEATGDLVFAWMLLWRAVVASEALSVNTKKSDMAFYEGQLKTAEFFISSILPVTLGKINSIQALNGAIVEISEESFGSKRLLTYPVSNLHCKSSINNQQSVSPGLQDSHETLAAAFSPAILPKARASGKLLPP